MNTFSETPRRLFGIICCLAFLLASGCDKKNEGKTDSKASPAESQDVNLSGAGATFPFPLYSKWMSQYNKLHPNIKINYQSIGSGGGVRQVSAGTVDFGATDAPMKPEVAKKTPGKVHHIPTTIGSVVVAYNLPGVEQKLKLEGPLVADIYLGKVKKWNDDRIKALNEGVDLPDKNITVVYRSDGSGTTAVFTDYLGKVSDEWKKEVGVGKSVRWPAGLGAKGNEGVTGQVKTTPGAVGYVELAYALQNKLSFAQIKNKAGNFVEPNVEAITAAAKNVEFGEDLTASLANPEGENVYPISSFTYLLVYQEAKDEAKGKALADFLWWALHDGQKYASELHYAPLPESVIKKAEELVKGLTYGGKPLLEGL